MIKDSDTVCVFDIESDYFVYQINVPNHCAAGSMMKLVPSDGLPNNSKKPKRFLAENHHIRKVRK